MSNEGVGDDRFAFGVLGKDSRRAEHFTHFGKRSLVDFDLRIDAGKIVARDVLVDAGIAVRREGDRGGKAGGDDDPPKAYMSLFVCRSHPRIPRPSTARTWSALLTQVPIKQE